MNLLEIKNLKKYFPIKSGVFSRTVNHIKAVDGVDLNIGKGTTLGLVGESGCGKSTLGKTIIKLLNPTEGQIIFENTDITDQPESGTFPYVKVNPVYGFYIVYSS